MSALVTHHVPYFTRSITTPAGTVTLEQAVCGSYVAWNEIAPAETEPTCSLCLRWLTHPVTKEEHNGEDRTDRG